MKGGGGRKEAAEGEASNKQRPKRKCLQWHPLLSKKKALDFSEEEEEDDEEELEKVATLCTERSAREPECGALEDEASEEDGAEQRARRPMNAFLLFCKRHRSLVRQEHPRLDNRGATKILADWWAVLEPAEKQKYTDMAKEYKDAFMKANPGYKWCPATSKPVKSPTHAVGSVRKKAWSLPSNATKDAPLAKKVPKSDCTPQLNFAMADPTKMGGLSMLLLAGEHALTAREVSSCPPQPAEGHQTSESRGPASPQTEILSSGSQASLSEGKQCGQSALFQLAEMCLASEAEKLEALSSQPAVDSSSLCAQHSTASTLPTTCRAEPDLSQPAPSSSSSSSSPTEGGTPALVPTPKKKRVAPKETKGDKGPASPRKPCRKRPPPASDLESLMYTIEAVAKGAWGPEEVARKRARDSGVAGADGPAPQPTVTKKKSKLKAKKQLRVKDEVSEEEGRGGVEDVKEAETEAAPPIPEPEPKAECKEETEMKAEPPSHVEDTAQHSSAPQAIGTDEEAKSPQPVGEGDPPRPVRGEERDSEGKPARGRPEEREVEAKPEACGSRKSERSCKGALYKTLVSEGMLTSLRANVDRGKRVRGSVSEHDAAWTEESCTFSPPAVCNPKKLKKSKSKEESGVPCSLGKLEEEFEEKFNSLPQYNPLTFDRKSTTVSKRKRAGSASLLPADGKGPSPSQKKTLFHKIVSKYKHRKEEAGTSDKAAVTPPESAGVEAGPGARGDALSASLSPVPVGSQKRKARKNKITHLVRTADGRPSPAEADKAKELTQDQEEKPLTREPLCNQESCYSERRPAEEEDGADLPAFFSLAALAEVAAMENIHRGQRSMPMPPDGQVKDVAPVLISCADQ